MTGSENPPSWRSAELFRSGVLWLSGALLASALIGSPALGQSASQGTILGTVYDESGGVIPGAEVTALNPATGTGRTVTSDELGTYRIDFLNPGEYQVAVELPGFKRLEVPGVILKTGQLLRVDAHLQVGELQEIVTITAETMINTESVALGEVVDSHAIEEMPLNGREFVHLAGLVPGAVTASGKRGVADAVEGFNISFNGARSTQNAFNVDGVDSTDAEDNQLITSPPLDAIREFRVETNMYSAQLGRSGGAVINVTTKSGTNEFHGSLWEYHRNKALDAMPRFHSGTREELPPYLYNQFGGTFGGPIIKNRTFFFVSGELFRSKDPSSTFTLFAPTARERAGDFTETLNVYTLQPAIVFNPYTREVLPEAILPDEFITPLGRKLMDLWTVEPNRDDPFLNAQFLRGQWSNRDKYLTRIDHHLSDNDQLSASFNFGDREGLSAEATKQGDKVRIHRDRTIAAGYTRILSPSLVNDFKFGYNWYDAGDEYFFGDQNYGRELGMWAGGSDEMHGFPYLRLQGFGREFRLGTSQPDARYNRNLYFKNDLVWRKGRHTLFVGGDLKHQSYKWVAPAGGGALGAYRVGFRDGQSGRMDRDWISGTTFGDLLMSVVQQTQWNHEAAGSSGGSGLVHLTRNLIALWLQDDWKITPKLTLHLGLRYDYMAPFSEANGKLATLNWDTGMIVYGAGAPAERLALVQFPFETGGPNRPFDPNTRDFSPRIGFAFRPSDDNRMVIRAGYGIFYEGVPATTTKRNTTQVPFGEVFTHNIYRSYWPAALRTHDRFYTLDQKPPDLELLAGVAPAAVRVTEKYFPDAYYQQWNVSVERLVARRTAVELAYVGSKGTQLDGLVDSRIKYPELTEQIDDLYGREFALFMAKGNNSNYSSLQVKVRRDLSQGFNLLSAFTWGHALAETSNSALNENDFQDFNDDEGVTISRRRWANADFDVRKRLTVAGGYAFPYGRQGGSGLLHTLFGGWQGNWIVTLQSGYWFSVRDGNNRTPNRIGDGNLPADQRHADHWYDFTAFETVVPIPVVDPETGQTLFTRDYGNAGINIIEGPGLANTDFGVRKNFSIGEVSRIEFRADFFNLFNRVNYIGRGNVTRNRTFINSVSGARLEEAHRMRDIQFALRVIF